MLPEPAGGAFAHLVLLGGPEGLDVRVREAGIARSVTAEIPRGRTADAVAVLGGALPSVESVAGCLRPGGLLYWEVSRRFLGGSVAPARFRRALRESGLHPTATYWITPDLVGRQLFLPIDGEEALAWYYSTVFVPATPALRLRRAFLLRFPSAAAGLARAYAVTAVTGEAGIPPAFVFGRPDLPAALRRADLRSLVLTAGGDDWNRVVLLPFVTGGSQPVAVLKLSRVPERNTHTQNEQESLRAIGASLDGEMRATIPEPLGSLLWNGLVVGIESCLPGPLLSVTTGAWGERARRKVEDLRLSVAWLTEFHRRAPIRRLTWSEAERRDWVERPLEDYLRAFGRTPAEERLFAGLLDRARSLEGITLPVVWQHYGFGVWNVCRSDGRVRVFDWEAAEPGLPLLDLFYFVMHWSFLARGLRGTSEKLRGFRELFCEPGRRDPVLDAARAAVVSYGEGLGLDRRFFPIPLVLLWAAHAVSSMIRRRNLTGEKPDPRRGNRYVDYVVALAECGDWLLESAAADPPSRALPADQTVAARVPPRNRVP